MRWKAIAIITNRDLNCNNNVAYNKFVLHFCLSFFTENVFSQSNPAIRSIFHFAVHNKKNNSL